MNDVEARNSFPSPDVNIFSPYRSIPGEKNLEQIKLEAENYQYFLSRTLGLNDLSLYQRFLERLAKEPRCALVPMHRMGEEVPEGKVLVGLRHDMDGEPFSSLCLSRALREQGVPGSFYVLHTASYYGSFEGEEFLRNEALGTLLRTIQEDGCEVGLHTDGLHVYQQWGVDGSQAVAGEISWLRSQGLRIVGTAAHNTAPTYGAENFELFVGRAVFDRRSFFRNEQEYPLQILSEADLDLSYEANFPDVNASVRGRELGRYLANVPFDPMRNANWLYGHLLNNPYWHSAYDYNVLLIGPDKWVIAGQRHRDAAFLFDVKLQDVFRFLHQIEANTRVVFHLHPVYFAETGAESRIEPSRTARPHLGQWFAQVQKEVADNHAQILSRLEQAEGRMFGELGNLEARAGLELESLRDGMNSRLDQIFTRVSQYPGYRLVNFVRVNAKRLLKLGYLAFLCLGAVMPKPRRPRQQGKRILMLTISQIDIDSRINKEARSLAREGYSVDIFCLQHQRYESSLVEEQVMPGVRYIRILTQWKEANLFFQEAFRRAALVRDYDYVHAHDLTTLLTGWLIARKKGVPLIYDAHEMWSENVVWKGGEYRGMPFYVRLLARMWEGFLVRYVDLLITVSPSIVQAFRQRYRLKSDPLLLANYVELGIDLSADYPAPGIRELCGLGDDAFVTLYLGGINQVRNIENVIEAHRMLPENAVFVIRGPSIEYFEEQYLELARGLGLQGRVFCLPPVGRDEVIAGARGADCGVILLRNLCRNFYWYYPNKFFEYMLAGIPVIASNFPDVTAHLERERSGLVCDPESPEAIAETIRRLYEHREEAREMGRRGRASIYRQYNWEEAIKELLERYRRLYGFKS